MERLREKRPSGASAGTLRAFGMFFIATGVVGRCILQRQLLGVGAASMEELLFSLQASEQTMVIATLSLILQAMETVAVPIFALLLVEGFLHTSGYRGYLLRILGTALLSEIPYNLAMSGKVLDLTTRNPLFGMAIALIALYFYGFYHEKSTKNTVIKAVVTFAALMWPLMLNVENGVGIVAAAAVIWAFRKKPLIRNMAGVSAMALCSVFSPFLLAAPMGFLAVHVYNGERGSDSRLRNYLFYPVLLLAAGLAGLLLF